MWHPDLFDAQILAQNVINGADSFPLLAVPFFMLAGEIMNVGGLSQRIVKLALTLVGTSAAGWGLWPFWQPACWPHCRAPPWPIRRAGGPAAAHDGEGRARQGARAGG